MTVVNLINYRILTNLVFQMEGFTRQSMEKFQVAPFNENITENDMATTGHLRGSSSNSPSIMGTSMPVGIPWRASLSQQQSAQSKSSTEEQQVYFLYFIGIIIF